MLRGEKRAGGFAVTQEWARRDYETAMGARDPEPDKAPSLR